MKTNHRDGTRNKTRPYRGESNIKAMIKAEARKGRRNGEKKAFQSVVNGLTDWDNVTFPLVSMEISNRWNWD